MSLEQRIQVLEDIEAIKKLKARYFHACDRKHVDVIRECFVEGDCMIDYGAVGVFKNREGLIDLFTEKACLDSIIDMHHGQNPQITVMSDTIAVAAWDLFFYQINTEADTLMQLAGFYEDKFKKTNKGWRIEETKFNVTSTLVSQLEEGLPKVVAAMNPQLIELK